jgi:hypothetical protein
MRVKVPLKKALEQTIRAFHYVRGARWFGRAQNSAYPPRPLQCA